MWLVLKELKGTSNTAIASNQACVTPSSTWHSFPAVTVKTSGDAVTVDVLEKPPVADAAYTH